MNSYLHFFDSSRFSHRCRLLRQGPWTWFSQRE